MSTHAPRQAPWRAYRRTLRHAPRRGHCIERRLLCEISKVSSGTAAEATRNCCWFYWVRIIRVLAPSSRVFSPLAPSNASLVWDAGCPSRSVRVRPSDSAYRRPDYIVKPCRRAVSLRGGGDCLGAWRVALDSPGSEFLAEVHLRPRPRHSHRLTTSSPPHLHA